MRQYTTQSDMAVIEYLLKVEKDGEDFYRKLADQATSKGLQRIFNMLAEEELKHYKAIEEYSKTGKHSLAASSKMAAITKNLFTQLQNDPNVDFLGMKDQVHVYAQARDIELKNRDEYLKRAEEAADPQVKTLFEQVAMEEEQHAIALHEMVHFLDDTWTENAEYIRFHHSVYDPKSHV
jgi:rubrerythrin